MKKNNHRRKPTQVKPGQYIFNAPPGVVEASKDNCGHLVFKLERVVSEQKVRIYSSDENPDGLGESVIISTPRSLIGLVHTEVPIKEKEDNPHAMKVLVENLDEIKKCQLTVDMQFAFSKIANNDPVVQFYVACDKNSEKIKGVIYAVTRSEAVVASAHFIAQRKGQQIGEIGAAAGKEEPAGQLVTA